METCIVYRWEHEKTGYGPYHNSGEILFIHEDIEFHPNINQDKIINNEELFNKLTEIYILPIAKMIMPKKDTRFGFLNIEQMKNWFNEEEIKLLYNKGYKLTKYKVENSDIVILEKQVIFDIKNINECGYVLKNEIIN